MSNLALMNAIFGILHPVKPKITRVGGCTPASSTTSVSSLNLGLPAAAVAGDVVLASIISNADQYVGAYSNSGPVGSTKFVADTSFQHPAPHPGVGSAYAVRLSATDITNGYVTFNFTNLPSGSVRGVVWRGVSQNMFDVAAGVAAATATVANPFTFAAPGITTRTNGCTLVAMGAVVSAAATAITTPDGFTVADVGNDISILQQFAYQQQASAGDTGDVSMTFGPDNSISPQGWFAWLVALRPIAPAITLSATFPTSLHVGDSGSFDITATLIDGATGSLTITGSSLPDGMSIGSTTDNGDDTFTATATYDLTTVQDITASFGTTGGSVAATALTHEFDVTAEAAIPSLAQVRAATAFATSVSNTFSPAPTEGDLLVAAVSIADARTITSPPTGFALFGVSSVNAVDVYVYTKVSDGTEGTIGATQSGSGQCGIALYDWQNASALAGFTAADLGTFGAETTQITVGPTTAPPVDNAVPVASYVLSGTQNTPTNSAGWTMDNLGKQSFGIATAHMATPPTTAVSDTVTISVPGTRSGTAITYWVKP